MLLSPKHNPTIPQIILATGHWKNKWSIVSSNFTGVSAVLNPRGWELLTLVANPLELQKATFSTAQPDRLNKIWRISSLKYFFDNFLRIFFRKVPNNPIIQISNYLKKIGLYPLLVWSLSGGLCVLCSLIQPMSSCHLVEVWLSLSGFGLLNLASGLRLRLERGDTLGRAVFDASLQFLFGDATAQPGMVECSVKPTRCHWNKWVSQKDHSSIALEKGNRGNCRCKGSEDEDIHRDPGTCRKKSKNADSVKEEEGENFLKMSSLLKTN